MQTHPYPVQLYPIDYHTREQGFFSSPHRHTVAEIFYFIAGEGTHYIDFTAYPIRAHTVFLIAPQQVHYIEAPAHTHNLGYVISLDTTLLDVLEPDFRALFGKFTQSPSYQLPESTAYMLQPALIQLTDELQSQLPRKGMFVKLVIDLLLTYVLRADFHSGSDNSPRPSAGALQFAQFIARLEDNYSQLHTVMHYADLLAVTPRQLNRICRQIHGQSALAVIHERIALEAKRLLFYSNHPIKEIAYQLGFNDPAHFTHFFRRLIGQTPELFRAQMSHIRK